MPAPDYAELHCLSNFSFLRGASHPQELVLQAAALGYRAIAITDECSLAGVVRAHEAAREAHIQLIVGSELVLEDGHRLVLLAPDRDAYGDLSVLISAARRRAAKGRYVMCRADLPQRLSRCMALVPTGWRSEHGHALCRPGFAAHLAWVREHFPDRAWVAVQRHREPGEERRIEILTAQARRHGLALVAAGDVHMHRRARRALQDVLTAVRHRGSVSDATHALFMNGERHLRPRETLARLYAPEWLAASVALARRCSFSLDELRYEYPDELVPAGKTAALQLRDLTEHGATARFPAGVPEAVAALLQHELALIAELGYEPYFLTVHDLVRFARERGILCQGRGSAANSAVCFCLGITEVDPSRMSMLFERFVSRERNEPPDIDVDFEHERREEVMQYIYRRYGRSRAALAATVISYRPRSAIRDLGKALGLEPAHVAALARSVAWWDGARVLPERVRELGLDPDSGPLRRLIALLPELLGFPRHLSQHTGGFVIARDSVERLVPVENAAMPARTVIQWDKDDLESLGLLKVDVLALGMLTCIRKAFELVAAYSGRRHSMASVPVEDPDTYAMIQRADTMGVFQIESRAQMAMLPRMRPRCFYDLVIEVAIVRPGPIQGGMVHPYLRRRQGLEPVSYPSQAVRGVLERTLGVPIFQEQVMQLAVVAAGFSPGEADSLRRAMAAFRKRGTLEPFRQRLISGMLQRGYDETFAQQVFRQIEGFGEYGFPESHSASFALLVYVSAWLKQHEPAAFCAALLNSQPMGFYAPAQLVGDARRHGVEVRPVDALHSEFDCTLEPTTTDAPALRLGLRLIKGIDRDLAQRLAQARSGGRVASVQALAQRASLSRAQLARLSRAGALKTLVGHRRHAHWQALGVHRGRPLVDDLPPREALPMLRTPTEGEDLVADHRELGLSLGRHPLALLRHRLATLGLVPAERLRRVRHGERLGAAGLVINRQRPSTASGVMFATLEDETGYINLVLWPWLVERARREVLGARLMVVHGEVQREGEVIHLVAHRVEDHSELLGRLFTRSRDFQ
jgi:error-prone DNA polymerase